MKRGPLGALPQLSKNARRALAGVGALAFLNALALVAQAVALASVITTREGLPLLAVAIVARAGLSWATESAAARAAAGAKEELRTQLLAKSFERGPGWIADRGPLRVDIERAAEIIWVQASPDVATMVRGHQGWDRDEYAAWLEDTLVRLLLPD